MDTTYGGPVHGSPAETVLLLVGLQAGLPGWALGFWVWAYDWARKVEVHGLRGYIRIVQECCRA